MKRGKMDMCLGQLLENVGAEEELVKKVRESLVDNNIISKTEKEYITMERIKKGLEETNSKPLAPIVRLEHYFRQQNKIQAIIDRLKEYRNLVLKNTNHLCNMGQQLGFDFGNISQIPKFRRVLRENLEEYRNKIIDNLLWFEVQKSLRKFQGVVSTHYKEEYLDREWERLSKEIEETIGNLIIIKDEIVDEKNKVLVPYRHHSPNKIDKMINQVKSGEVLPEDINMKNINGKIKTVKGIGEIVRDLNEECLNGFEDFLKEKIRETAEQTINCFRSRWKINVANKKIKGFNGRNEALKFAEENLKSQFSLQRYADMSKRDFL